VQDIFCFRAQSVAAQF